jgi:hypothetical protein
MRRRSDHGSSRPVPEPASKLLETIVDDVIAARAMSADDWRKLWPHPFTSMAISVGHGREQPCTQKGINAAHKLAEQSWEERGDLRQTVSRSAFTRLAFNAIGMAVTNSPTHLPADMHEGVVEDSFYDAVAADYSANLELLAAQARNDLDRHIPCHLFDADQNVPSFEVGPVHFRTRSDWIAAFVNKPGVLVHIREAEQHRLGRAELMARLLGPSAGEDARQAWNVLSTIGSYAWVATVRLAAHESARSHDKAATIVGLAIDAIGLRFHLEDARRFAKAGRQHLFNEDRLATTLDGRTLLGASSPAPVSAAHPARSPQRC